MCLSNVYSGEEPDSRLLFKNVASLNIDGDNITLTDILGIPTNIKGTVKKIDLLENIIIVEPVN